jgi:hypothetical protein
VTIIIVCLSCVGLTFILKYGTILKWFRAFLFNIKAVEKLFKCSLCLGFWSGLLHSIIMYQIKWDNIYFLLPLASSSLCWFIDSLLRSIQTSEILMDKIIEKNEKN